MKTIHNALLSLRLRRTHKARIPSGRNASTVFDAERPNESGCKTSFDVVVCNRQLADTVPLNPYPTGNVAGEQIDATVTAGDVVVDEVVTLTVGGDRVHET